MGVISTTVDANPVSLSAAVGDRIICIATSRGGAASGTVTPNTGGTWVERAGEYTLPNDGSNRRAVAIYELLVTSTISSVSYTAQMKDSGAGDVGTKASWLVIEEGSEYTFEAAATANSGTSTSTTQATGTTATIPAGDHLIVAAAASRGGTTAIPSWTLTDITPPLVGGGDGSLDSMTGGGDTANGSAGGYLLATGASAQTRADTITLDTARLTSAAIAVWVQSAGGTDATATPATFAAVAALPATTLSLGATAAPAVTAATATLPAATLAASSTVTPAAVSAAATLPAAAASASSATTPATITAAATLPAVTVSAGGSATAAPATVAAAATLPAATLSAGSTATPAAVAATVALPAAAPAASSTVTPATIPAIVAVPLANLVASSTVLPATIAAVTLLPQATVNGVVRNLDLQLGAPELKWHTYTPVTKWGSSGPELKWQTRNPQT